MSLRPLVVSIFIAAISTNVLALDIVSGGASAYTIIVPDQPVANVTYAATELQTYVQRITGAEVASGNQAGMHGDHSSGHLRDDFHRRLGSDLAMAPDHCGDCRRLGGDHLDQRAEDRLLLALGRPS